MNRRELLRMSLALKAGSAVMLPVNANPLPTPERQWPLPFNFKDEKHAPSFDAPAFGITKVGIVFAGSAACGFLTQLHGRLPYLSRSVVIDTSLPALQRALADRYVWVGRSDEKATDCQTVRLQAMAVKSEIRDAIRGLDLIWMVSSLGGAAGTGIAPVVADVANEIGVTVVAASTTPFDFEGTSRNQIAQAGLKAIARRVQGSVELPNQVFAANAPDELMVSILDRAAAKFGQLYRGTSTVLCQQGLIGVDLEDIQAVLAQGSGLVVFGHGSGDSLTEAYRSAVNDELLGSVRLHQAKGVFVTLNGPWERIKMDSLSETMAAISGAAPDALAIFGATVDKATTVTILAVK